MSQSQVIQSLDQEHMKSDITFFEVGDTIEVHCRIIEGNKERIQLFKGTVIAKTGSGISETFSLHRIAYGKGMERVFILNSPRIAKINVLKKGRVRRAKLYYLRGTQGKRAKVRSRFMVKKTAKQVVQESSTPTAPTISSDAESNN